ncbi:MAG TPA: GGDEF domain-containing protein [Dehalococcoidia bacterium]|nr:GGDEF domain-containing protein [Dehalococcoidia bacterium]
MLSRSRREGGASYLPLPRSEPDQTELVRPENEVGRFDSRYVAALVVNRWLILLAYVGLAIPGLIPIHPLALAGSAAWIFLTNAAATWSWMQRRRVSWYDSTYLFMDVLSVTFGVLATANLDYPIWIAYVMVMVTGAAELNTRSAFLCVGACIGAYSTSAAILHLAGWYNVNPGVFAVTAAIMGFAGFNVTVAFDGSRRLRSYIRQMSVTDPLTGLANRRRLSEMLANPGRSDTAIAVIVLDVDNFKQYNDSQGHLAGDRLLVRLARNLEDVFYDAHTISRYGGDEFVVLLPCNDVGVAAKRAGALVCDHYSTDVPVSIGVAVWPHHESTLDGALAAADDCLREAKRSGKNRLVSLPNP